MNYPAASYGVSNPKTKHNPAIFCRTDQMIDQHRDIVALVYILTHLYMIEIKAVASYGELNPRD